MIAAILVTYAPHTPAPRTVLLSLPNMTPARVDAALEGLLANRSERAQRGAVLKLLEGVRGVSIYEMGKVDVSGGSNAAASAKKRGRRPVMDYDIMALEADGVSGLGMGERGRGPSPELGGLAEMFG